MGLTEQFGGLIPSFVLRRLLTVETAIEQGVTDFAAQTPTGARVLDAGAGEGRYAQYFPGRRYVGIDLAVGDAAWDYSGIDALGDLAKLPFPDDTFDAALNIVTLEHVPEPLAVLREIARVLRPGGRLFLVAPQQWEVHQAPHDFYRYTRHGLAWLLERAGLVEERLEPMGGFFTLLARRLTATLNYCQGGARWLLFPFVAVVVGPLALLLPSLDVLDPKKDFTLAYRCVARKP
ncbi:MAG: class I SAM-dependent methyltransferase [Bryobacterales bacterium]